MKVTDPDWLERLEEEQTAGERRQTPSEFKGEQARAEKRRKAKSATMRKLRAEGRARPTVLLAAKTYGKGVLNPLFSAVFARVRA